jgi:hypothetical protein
VITYNGGTCEATIGSQGPLPGLSYGNAGGKVNSAINVKCAATKTKDGIGCPFSGTGAAVLNYSGHVPLGAVNAVTGVPVPISWQ